MEADAGPDELHERFDAARLRGNEGLVLKRLDSPYTPGRRGKWWLKLKRELATLDCVVVGVERGHGNVLELVGHDVDRARERLQRGRGDGLDPPPPLLVGATTSSSPSARPTAG